MVVSSATKRASSAVIFYGEMVARIPTGLKERLVQARMIPLVTLMTNLPQ